MAKRPQRQNQAPHNAPPVEVGSMDFWRGIVLDIAPDKIKDDENHVNELATMIQQGVQSLVAHFPKASQICDKTEDKSISIGMGFKLCRLNTPAELVTRISYSESYGDKTEVRVPDPTQPDLPLGTGEGGDKSE